MRSLKNLNGTTADAARHVVIPGWLLAFLGGLAAIADCVGQSTMAVSFEGPPLLFSGQWDIAREYVESGIRFEPLFPGTVISQGVVRFRGPYGGFPDDGSTYFGGSGSPTNMLAFGLSAGGAFSLFSVELADYSVNLPGPGAVQFVGHRIDGSVVTQDFSLQRLIVDGRPAFETFSFGPEFSDLERVEIPSHYWWMDNLVVLIPEPSSLVLWAGGGLFVVACALRTKRRA